MNSQESSFSTSATEPDSPALYEMLVRANSSETGKIECGVEELRRADKEVSTLRVRLENQLRAAWTEFKKTVAACREYREKLDAAQREIERLKREKFSEMLAKKEEQKEGA